MTFSLENVFNFQSRSQQFGKQNICFLVIVANVSLGHELQGSFGQKIVFKKIFVFKNIYMAMYIKAK